MHTKLTTAVLAASVAVALTGSGFAIGASTSSPAVKACESKSSHDLALLKHGKCALGFTKVTIAERGPKGARGKTGKQGPGSVSETLVNPNDDEQELFPTTFDGFQIATTCGMASGLGIAVNQGTNSFNSYGTFTQDGVVKGDDGTNISAIGASGTTSADLDVIVVGSDGNFFRFDVHGDHEPGACHYSAVVTPTTAAAAG